MPNLDELERLEKASRICAEVLREVERGLADKYPLRHPGAYRARADLIQLAAEVVRVVVEIEGSAGAAADKPHGGGVVAPRLKNSPTNRPAEMSGTESAQRDNDRARGDAYARLLYGQLERVRGTARLTLEELQAIRDGWDASLRTEQCTVCRGTGLCHRCRADAGYAARGEAILAAKIEEAKREK